jgi:hypothetical protein
MSRLESVKCNSYDFHSVKSVLELFNTEYNVSAPNEYSDDGICEFYIIENMTETKVKNLADWFYGLITQDNISMIWFEYMNNDNEYKTETITSCFPPDLSNF